MGGNPGGASTRIPGLRDGAVHTLDTKQGAPNGQYNMLHWAPIVNITVGNAYWRAFYSMYFILPVVLFFIAVGKYLLKTILFHILRMVPFCSDFLLFSGCFRKLWKNLNLAGKQKTLFGTFAR